MIFPYEFNAHDSDMRPIDPAIVVKRHADLTPWGGNLRCRLTIVAGRTRLDRYRPPRHSLKYLSRSARAWFRSCSRYLALYHQIRALFSS